MNEQVTIRALKFVGYAGVSIASLMIPLFIFKISGNIAAAGLCMLLEWFPKIIIYLVGGGLARHVGALKLYRRLEIARVLAMLLLLLTTGPLAFIWVVAFASATIQCSNAMSNILFESLVKEWWDTEKGKGYSLLMRGDLLAGIIVVPALSYLPTQGILMVGVIAFIANVIASYFLKKIIFEKLDTQPSGEESFKSLAKGAYAGAKDIFAHKALSRLTQLTIMIGLPGGMIMTQLPFFFNKTNTALAGSALFLAWFASGRSVCAIAALKFSSWVVHRGFSSKKIMIFGVVANIFGPLMVVWCHELWEQCLGVIFMSSGFFLYTVFSRERRQILLSEHQDPISLTGIMSAIESMAYVGGGIILFCFPQYLEWVISICVLILVLILCRNWKSIHRAECFSLECSIKKISS